MKVTITGRKVNLRDNFKELATKKLSRFDRIFDDDADAHVVVTVEHNRQTVEITIRQRGMIYRAEATEFEMIVSLAHWVVKFAKIKQSWKRRFTPVQSTNISRKPLILRMR